MGISGNLKTMVLAELLQWLSMGQKSGTLVIDNQAKKITKRIFFDEGVIISSASTDPKEYLGRFLASHGFIPEDVVDEALSKQADEKQLLGKILVNMGAISEEDLHQMLRLKAEESIYDIFTWEEGDFEFLDNQLPEKTMIRMQLDVQGIVLEGTRRVDEWNRIREVVPSDLCVPVAMLDNFDALEIDEIDRTLLEWIDDDRTVEEISNEAQISLFSVASVMAQAANDGHIKLVRPRLIEVEVHVPVADRDDTEDASRSRQPSQQQPSQQPPPQQPPQMMPQYNMPMYQQPMPAYPQQQPSPPMPMGDGRTLHFATGAPSGGNPLPGPLPQQGSAPAAPPTPSSEAEGLVQEAEAALEAGNLDEALGGFRKAKDAEGAAKIKSRIDAGESKISKALEQAGIALTSVPKLECGMEELTQLKISPQEGFMLTRVDGSFDIKSILKMSPMPALDAQMLFWRLKRSGHVKI